MSRRRRDVLKRGSLALLGGGIFKRLDKVEECKRPAAGSRNGLLRMMGLRIVNQEASHES
jgi:hypothetical protein